MATFSKPFPAEFMPILNNIWNIINSLLEYCQTSQRFSFISGEHVQLNSCHTTLIFVPLKWETYPNHGTVQQIREKFF